jgi:hypothetical protein
MSHLSKLETHTKAVLELRRASFVEQSSALSVALMTVAMSQVAYQRYLAEVQAVAAKDSDGKGFKALHAALRAGASRILGEEHGDEPAMQVAEASASETTTS